MIVKRCLMVLLFCANATPGFANDDSAEGVVRLLIDTDGKQHMQVRGGSYFFEPDHVIAKANVPVELLVVREWGIVPHRFVMEIPEAGIAIDEPLSTSPKTVTFTPTVIGKYEFYCRNKLLFFKGHDEQGMKGILEVVP